MPNNLPTNKPTDPWRASYKSAQDAHEQRDYETARKSYLRAIAESSYLPSNSEERVGIKVGLVGTLCSQGELKMALRLVQETRRALAQAYAEDTYRLAEMEHAIVFLMRSQPVKRG